MLLIALGWLYVVLMVAVVQATSDQGTALGAALTFAFYGLLPVGILVYLMLSPARRRARRLAEDAEREPMASARRPTSPADPVSAPGLDPDGGGHSPGDPVAAERKEP